MNIKRKFSPFWFTAVLILSILACSGGTKAIPTATLPPPPPPPTNTPLPLPTATLAPTPTTPPAAAPTATQPPATEAPATQVATQAPVIPATTGTLFIVQTAGYKNSSGYWHIFGMVTNDTKRGIDNIELEVEIFDKDKKSLYKEKTSTSIYTLDPGETTPFSFWVYEDLPTADNFIVTIIGNGASDITHAPVEVGKHSVVLDDSGDLHIVGEVTNKNDKPVNLHSLAAAMFDGAGKMLTGDSDSALLHYLEPGETAPFRITLNAPEGTIDQYKEINFYSDAEIASTIPEQFKLSKYEEAVDFLDAYDSFHLVGEIKNDDTVNVNVSLLVAIYDENDNVLDVTTASVSLSSLAPGETTTYETYGWGPMSYTKDAYGKAKTYRVFVDWYWTWSTTTEYMTLKTAGDAVTYDEYQGTFTGKVVNNTGSTLSSSYVIIGLYNSKDGKLIATGYAYVSDEIADQGTADYTVYVTLPKGFDKTTIKPVVIVAKGEKK